MSHPTLKVSRVDAPAGQDVRFTVWNPLDGRYEPQGGLDEAIGRVGALAGQVRELWVGHDERLAALREPPALEPDEEAAELRVSAQAARSYDVRSFDSPAWRHFNGFIAQAAAWVCGEVGFVVPDAPVPPPPVRRQSSGG